MASPRGRRQPALARGTGGRRTALRGAGGRSAVRRPSGCRHGHRPTSSRRTSVRWRGSRPAGGSWASTGIGSSPSRAIDDASQRPRPGRVWLSVAARILGQGHPARRSRRGQGHRRARRARGTSASGPLARRGVLADGTPSGDGVPSRARSQLHQLRAARRYRVRGRDRRRDRARDLGAEPRLSARAHLERVPSAPPCPSRNARAGVPGYGALPSADAGCPGSTLVSGGVILSIRSVASLALGRRRR